MGILVYTFKDCMNACASYNQYTKEVFNANTTCFGVSYDLNMNATVAGNCWLKAYNNTPATTNFKGVDSARLVQEPDRDYHIHGVPVATPRPTN